MQYCLELQYERVKEEIVRIWGEVDVIRVENRRVRFAHASSCLVAEVWSQRKISYAAPSFQIILEVKVIRMAIFRLFVIGRSN